MMTAATDAGRGCKMHNVPGGRWSRSIPGTPQSKSNYRVGPRKAATARAGPAYRRGRPLAFVYFSITCARRQGTIGLMYYNYHEKGAQGTASIPPRMASRRGADLAYWGIV